MFLYDLIIFASNLWGTLSFHGYKDEKCKRDSKNILFFYFYKIYKILIFSWKNIQTLSLLHVRNLYYWLGLLRWLLHVEIAPSENQREKRRDVIAQSDSTILWVRARNNGDRLSAMMPRRRARFNVVTRRVPPLQSHLQSGWNWIPVPRSFSATADAEKRARDLLPGIRPRLRFGSSWFRLIAKHTGGCPSISITSIVSALTSVNVGLYFSICARPSCCVARREIQLTRRRCFVDVIVEQQSL